MKHFWIKERQKPIYGDNVMHEFRRTYSATHARLTLPGIHNIPRWL